MESEKPSNFIPLNPDDAACERLRSVARPAVCDVEAPGIGERRLQLIVCPEFDDEPGLAWEVRQSQQGWFLFFSEIVESWPNVQLVDYRPVTIASAVLSSFFNRVIALSLPIEPDFETEGLDGEIWQLAVFGVMDSTCRFQWWTEPPPHWQPLASLAAEMREVFASATRQAG